VPLSLAAVVVLVPAHLRFLAGLTRNLEQADPPFENIVVVASGFRFKFQVLRILQRLKGRKVSVVFAPLASAGANRNLALSLITEDVICFLDADDLYHTHRNEIVTEIFQRYECDLLLHGFQVFSSAEESSVNLKYPIEPVFARFVSTPSITTQENRRREKELLGLTKSTNLRFVLPGEEFEVQHAHACVRREVLGAIKFHEEFGVRNEDGVFAQDIVEAGFTVTLTDLVLSFYRQGARAKPRLRRQLARSVSSFFGGQRSRGYLEIFRLGEGGFAKAN